MQHVKIWSPPEIVVEAANLLMNAKDIHGSVIDGGAVEVVRREEGSICSLRWVGDGGNKGEGEGGEEGNKGKEGEEGQVGEGGNGKEVEWWGNEKFGWC
jgi:hypothetical protein